MGWLWNSGSSSEQLDPYSKLDPGLRDFLDKESPLKDPSISPARTSTDTAQDKYRSQLGWTTPSTPSSSTVSSATSAAPAVPAESLYQDGRYADLWKSYRPQHEIEAAGKNDQDRLRDVIDAYNDRRAAIGRAAIENCVMEQMAERDCWENGTYWEKINMCRGSNRQFMRCYTMQSRFLKALGYLSLQRSAEEEERIQMHADKLYHDMLDREQAAEEAKKAGIEVPAVSQPLITPESTVAALGTDSVYARARQKAGGVTGLKLSDYTPERQEQIKKQLQGLSAEEKELEMQLIAGERMAQVEVAEALKERFEEERRSRADRRDRGRETVGDTIKRLWGWDK
jgi:hypothetical protein